jgi:CubicO group peptidase (beta-lactamase class C family)
MRAALIIIVLVSRVAAAQCASRPYWPSESWQRSAPAAQGVDSILVDSALATLSRDYPSVWSALLVRHGYIVGERYYQGHDSTERFDLRSATKSVVSVLAGIAIDRKLIRGPDQPIADLVPEAFLGDDLDARKRRITIRHLLTMTSGLDWNEADAGSYFVTRQPWALVVLGRKLVDEPGRRFNYSSGNAHLVSVAITRASQSSTREFANAYLFHPLGFDIPPTDWLGDPQGVSAGGAGLRLSARELAKIGLLYLDRGCWNGAQLVSESWVKQSTQRWSDPGPNVRGYGYLWWLSKSIPNAYLALGYGGQYLIVDPEHDAILVLTADPRQGDSRHFDVVKSLIEPAFH